MEHTKGPFKISRSLHPDNTGGYDYAVADSENLIVAEFFEHVAHDGNGGYVKLPAKANAELYVAAPDLLAVLTEALTHAAAGGCGRWQDVPWIMRARDAVEKATGK